MTGCKRDLIQGKKSLEGSWEVVAITTTYGEFVQNGFVSSYSVNDSGQVGTFLFSPDSVNYHFTRNDTSFSGSATWLLELDKVNEGFIKVNDYTLTLPNHFVFDVAFGDQTKNAEKKATAVTLRQIPQTGNTVIVDLSLIK